MVINFTPLYGIDVTSQMGLALQLVIKCAVTHDSRFCLGSVSDPIVTHIPRRFSNPKSS